MFFSLSFVIEVEKKNTDTAVLNIVSFIVFISIGLVLFITVESSEACMLSAIFGILGLLTGLVGLSMLRPTRIRVSDNYLTIIEPNRTRRYPMSEIKGINVRKAKRATTISILFRDGRKRIIMNQGISEKDMEALVKALKESAYGTGVRFQMVDERRQVESPLDEFRAEDLGDSPYKIK